MLLGPVELAAAGVSITLFNQASRITIFPLVSITTSFVAEEDTLQKISDIEKGLPNKGNDESRLRIPASENIEMNDISLKASVHLENNRDKSKILVPS